MRHCSHLLAYSPLAVAWIAVAATSALAGIPRLAAFPSFQAHLRSLRVHLHLCDPGDDGGSGGGFLRGTQVRVHLATFAVAAAATTRATTTARHVLRRKRGGIEKDFPGDSLKTRL